MAPSDPWPDEFRCAATGKLLYLPVITLHGVAYSYVALFEMFTKAQGLPICKVTKEPIYFLPSVCLPLHHHLLAEYKGPMKGRRQQDELEMTEKFGLPLPNVSEAPEEEGDAGFLEEFQCVVSKELAYEPCALSSGSIVSAYCVPKGGFNKDPDRLVACALHGQAPRRSEALETMIKMRFSVEYAERGMTLASEGLVGDDHADGSCKDFSSDDNIHWGLGCDGCGLWPIRGEAWFDVDCRDKAGFHLCAACYGFGFHKRVLTGKLMQGHLPKHRMLPVPQATFM